MTRRVRRRLIDPNLPCNVCPGDENLSADEAAAQAEELAQLARDSAELYAAHSRANPVSPDELRAAHQQGRDVKVAVQREFDRCAGEVEAMEVKQQHRELRGKALLADDQRELNRARRQAAGFASLISDMQPVHRLEAVERFSS